MITDYIVDGKEKNLLDEDWKVLIVLDACRYDYFEKTYQKYFTNGQLKKAVSPATSTVEWLSKTFNDSYDLTYISGNPYINSKTDVSDEFGNTFKASDRFSKIFDVWKFGWNDNLNSVPPSEISKTFLENNGSGRFILHYVQPHVPYISNKYAKYLNNEGQQQHIVRTGKAKESPLKPLKKIIRKILLTIADDGFIWRLKKFRGNFTQASLIFLEEGWPGLRQAYQENLEMVLEDIAKLVDKAEGNILITADHGELLGEYGRFGHPEKPRKPENTEVPWFTIKGKGKMKKVDKKKKKPEQKEATSSKDEEIIRKRLEALGYM
jgi:hypothetical protein